MSAPPADVAVARFLLGNLTLGTLVPVHAPETMSRRTMVLIVTSACVAAIAVSGAAWVAVRSAPTAPVRPVTRFRIALPPNGMAPHYLPSGHLAFVRNGVMLAVPFDLRTLRVTGTAVPLINDVFESVATGAAKLAVSGTRSVAYVPGGAQRLARAMVWVDRRGAVEPLPEPT